MFSFQGASDIACSISLMALALGPVVGVMEANGMSWGYSKFCSTLDKSPEIPSKPGFLFGYSVPLLALAATYSTEPDRQHTSQNLVTVLNVIHYIKRDLECMFMHKYSGRMNTMTCCLIAVFYSLCAFIQVATASDASPPAPAMISIGLALFCVGELGNLYHHYLLSTLRQPGEKRYKVPIGGLFGVVCCPHYLFELVAWLGIAIAGNHPALFCCLFAFICYLCGRSQATMAWYRKKMNGKDEDQKMPKNWKRLIPFFY